MLVTKKDLPLKVFNKFKLEITVENKKDLMYLWLLFNLGSGSLAKVYASEVNYLSKVQDLGNLDKGGIWKILDKEMEGKWRGKAGLN